MDGEGFGAVIDWEREVWEAVDAVFASAPDIMSISGRTLGRRMAHQSLVMPNLPSACSLSKVLDRIWRGVAVAETLEAALLGLTP